ncbi:Uncharacterised protein family (UPF0180) [Caminicella sporogenes DSM 14501]|uniref:Uncharacterized protein family (UPF0180) n=1 Tax=Caminicella sporogenes DSM 14501 TaxID=1121266 RepID=A0A1M6NDH3_9FIRM|nr:YkuS family protein [Caminicella sporogenes]SHJ93656.1 Uncharacterised protein family (UPF0180) [Caminicella sporogenes DSM 14501]
MKKTIIANNIPSYIIENLEHRGYRIVDNSYEGYVDAILFDSNNSSLGYLNVFDNVIDMNYGVFLVDVNNKTIDEIESILLNRSYSSIF